jgi:hypothetical protein
VGNVVIFFLAIGAHNFSCFRWDRELPFASYSVPFDSWIPTGTDRRTRGSQHNPHLSLRYSFSPPGNFRQNREIESSPPAQNPTRRVIGEGTVRTLGITHAEIATRLAQAGLDVPEHERLEIVAAAQFVEEMAERVRGKRAMGAEPAHIFPPPGT